MAGFYLKIRSLLKLKASVKGGVAPFQSIYRGQGEIYDLAYRKKKNDKLDVTGLQLTLLPAFLCSFRISYAISTVPHEACGGCVGLLFLSHASSWRH